MFNARALGAGSVVRADGSSSGPPTGRLRRSIFHVRPWLAVCVGALWLLRGQLAGAVQKREKDLRADAVVAKRFTLTGPEGKRSALLDAIPDGTTWLSVFDKEGSRRILLGVTGRSEPTLSLFDSKAKLRLNFGLDAADGEPNVQLSGGPRPGTMVLLSVSELGPSLSLSHARRGRLSMGLDDQGESDISLSGAGDERGVLLSGGGDNQHISMMGRNSGTRASWRMDPDGTPWMYLMDDEGKTAASVRVTKEGDVLFGKRKR